MTSPVIGHLERWLASRSGEERSRQEERKLLRAILESTSEGVYSVDLDGRIVSFNAAAERISGRDAQQVVGRNYVEALLLTDDSGQPLSRADPPPLECCIATKKPVYLPIVYLERPDGQRIPITLSTSPILGPLGGPAWCVTVFRDLSRDREVEALKVNLISLVSHELRTPLTHIRGFVSTLLQRDVQWDAETQQEFLGDIEQEVERLDKLITDLLDMSRMQAGVLDTRERLPTAPRRLVEDAIERIHGLLAGRQVTVDCPADLPEIEVDPAAIARVLANLLENAAKYSPPGSQIRVTVGRDPSGVRFTVEDRGAGIPPQDLERVFEKFVRLQRPGGARVPGAGLGLAICRGTVTSHCGAIWAENREDGGARVVVSLPVEACVLAAVS